MFTCVSDANACAAVVRSLLMSTDSPVAPRGHQRTSPFFLLSCRNQSVCRCLWVCVSASVCVCVCVLKLPSPPSTPPSSRPPLVRSLARRRHLLAFRLHSTRSITGAGAARSFSFLFFSLCMCLAVVVFALSRLYFFSFSFTLSVPFSFFFSRRPCPMRQKQEEHKTQQRCSAREHRAPFHPPNQKSKPREEPAFG